MGLGASTHIVSIRNLVIARHDSDRAFTLKIAALDIRPGEKLALTGESGSGKSTALNVLSLSQRPDSADTFLMQAHTGRTIDIDNAWRHESDALDPIRARGLGIVRQIDGLAPFLSLRKNIGLSLRLAHTPGARHRKLITQTAEALGIGHCLDAKPRRLSVGQRQRGAIARALVHAPQLILADEPTSALDPQNAHDVMERFDTLSRETGSAIVLATHDAGLAERFGFTVCPLEHHRDGNRQITRLDRQQAADTGPLL